MDAAGYNAVNFREFTFLPTEEAPNHDHARYEQTMLDYYAFASKTPQKLTAWRRQDGGIDLVTNAGHEVVFPGINPYPVHSAMRHYLFLSREHAIEKYVRRRHDAAGLELGWHGWRTRLQHDVVETRQELLELPSQSELREYVSDDTLDQHPIR